MTAFWVAVIALTAVAIAGLLPALVGRRRSNPLVRRALNVAVHRDRLAELERQLADADLSPEQAASARAEIEQELLRDVDLAADGARPRPPAPRWVAVLVALAVPIFAFVVYLEIGTPEAARRLPSSVAPTPAQEAATHAGAPLETLVAGLAQRLQQNPNDLQGWVMLGRSYASLERHAEAREAFEAASRLAPESAEILTSLAESTALAGGGSLGGRPEELLRRALELRPDYPDALWLSGLAASQRQQYAEATRHWERLLAQLQSPQQRQMVSRYIAEARQQAGPAAAAGPSPVEPAPAPQSPPAGAKAASLTVRVALAPELQDRVSSSDTVYIFARPAEGSRMPLAIVRRTVADLPASLTLDDSMAMNPAMKLSAFDQVVVAARVSRSGSATPQAGDLEGASAPVSPTGAAAPIDLRIDRQL